jgi:pimeloyl-[acyl-carrier protein] methyl ester esterase
MAAPVMSGFDVRVLLVHGWGYGPKMWADMIRHLPATWQCKTLGNWDFSETAPDDYDLYIGHSYGFLAGYRALPDARWVSINSAPCFVAGPQNPGGIPARVLARMIQGFTKNPNQVLRDFQQKAGAPYPCTTDSETLKNALIEMQKESFPTAPLFCALASAQDPILSYPWDHGTETVAIHQSKSHLLPMTHPAWCAEKIIEAMA